MTAQSETDAGREYLSRPDLQGKIEFREVSFSYPGETARALAPKPCILLLDEPSSALDAQAEAALIARLEKATRGRSLLIVTHRMSMVRLVDRIILLDRGRILVDGPRDTVLRAMASARDLKTRRLAGPKLVSSIEAA